MLLPNVKVTPSKQDEVIEEKTITEMIKMISCKENSGILNLALFIHLRMNLVCSQKRTEKSKEERRTEKSKEQRRAENRD